MSDNDTASTRPEMTDEQYAAKFMKTSIGNVAARLRKMADEVERLGQDVDRVGRPGFPNYGTVASNVVSEIRNGMANVHTENVVRDAADADIARAEAKAADQ